MRLPRNMILIMMRSTQMNTALLRAKGYFKLLISTNYQTLSLYILLGICKQHSLIKFTMSFQHFLCMQDLCMISFHSKCFIWNQFVELVQQFCLDVSLFSQCLCLFIVQIASFLLYLSNVEAGGETMFPYEVDQGIYCLLSDTLHRES